MRIMSLCVWSGDLSSDHNYLSMYIMEKLKVKLEKLISVGSFFKRCLYIKKKIFFLKLCLSRQMFKEGVRGKEVTLSLFTFSSTPM